jgi:hypothetical protein
VPKDLRKLTPPTRRVTKLPKGGLTGLSLGGFDGDSS